MGFWARDKADQENRGWDDTDRRSDYRVAPAQYPCEHCGAVFGTRDDLRVHLFDGHTTTRPVLMLRGRECGRTRESVIARTQPADWSVRNAAGARVNGTVVPLQSLGAALSDCATGVVSVRLNGATDQDFEFAFSIADEADLMGVDERLEELLRGRSLTLHTIDQFIERSRPFLSARRYRDGLASYLYGALAREGSSESGLLQRPGEQPAYVAKYDEAVASLGKFDRAPAEAVCGLVAFHYNQFDLAMRKTRSPRVARASRRLAQLLAGATCDDPEAISGRSSLDYALSDSATERVLSWCCIPLDGTAAREVADMERAVETVEPLDQLKLHVIAAEHHLAVGNRSGTGVHLSALRNKKATEAWVASMRDRTE